MEERDKLKPCPFCGGRSVLKTDSNGHYIECNNGMCKVMPTTWYYDTEERAIEAWNERGEE